MSEEMDYMFWESLISPGTSKKKKSAKRRKNGSKRKNNITLDVNGSIPKKKKNSTFKDVIQSKKDKKKRKKKLLDLHSLLGSSDTPVPAETKADISNLHDSAQKQRSDHLLQDSKKEGQRRKKVAFNLTHEYARVKRPNFSSAHPKFPKECKDLKTVPMSNCERYSLVREVVQYQSQLQEKDICCEDSNSQDLFITQKTFRSSSSDSSAEDSYKAITRVSQQTQTLHNSWDQIKYQDSDSCQPPRKKKQHQQTAKASSEVKDRLRIRKKKQSFQIERANFTGEKATSTFSQSSPNMMTLCMDESVVADRSPKVAKSKQCHCEEIQQAFSCSLHAPLKPKACTATQTENFFTDHVSSYLAFLRKRRLASDCDLVKPLDLSLPKRARKDLGWAVKESVSEVRKDEKCCESGVPPFPKDINAPSFSSLTMKNPEVEKRVAVSDKRKGKTTMSPLTQSDPKSGDTTTFTDCNDPPCRSKKVALHQVAQCLLNDDCPSVTAVNDVAGKMAATAMLSETSETLCMNGMLSAHFFRIDIKGLLS
ncbi:uncharacterized protein LOC133501729 isoform X2 [Syngnathoides biaculeatus]|uniref:uncharacterized protein LOC133501729 isoform X2 n=1 Tax=Syngnathoides biaculeatus TaxID=300417 RepID=UPI002ADDAA94|nr:uncharacterized protein LOC133501729 isoform X2 [Syngnathoides biaculeatus]